MAIYEKSKLKLSKKEQEALAKDIQEKYQKSFELKQDFVDDWWTAVSFANGQQYVSFRNGQPVSPKSPRHRVRITNNICGPIVATLTAKLTRNRPGVVGVPRTADDTAVKAAPAMWSDLDVPLCSNGINNVKHNYVFQAKNQTMQTNLSMHTKGRRA